MPGGHKSDYGKLPDNHLSEGVHFSGWRVIQYLAACVG
jgi:hypothetical protein